MAVIDFPPFRGANAGGYCHPLGVFGSYEYENYVWSSDEMTPRYKYTWGGGQFFLAASIPTHCYAHCYCNSAGKARTSRSRFTVWQFLRNHQLILHGHGLIDYGKRSPMLTGIDDRIASVLPPQDGTGGFPSGTCGADGKQFYPAPWPLAEFGPIPKAPPYSIDIIRPLGASVDGTKDLTVCGNRWSGSSDCKVSLNNYSCDCPFPNSEGSQSLGSDPIFPPSTCLALDRVNFGLLSSLIGRDEKAPRYINIDEQEVPYRCRCNTTYNGNECCSSSDGMVWLE